MQGSLPHRAAVGHATVPARCAAIPPPAASCLNGLAQQRRLAALSSPAPPAPSCLAPRPRTPAPQRLPQWRPVQCSALDTKRGSSGPKGPNAPAGAGQGSGKKRPQAVAAEDEEDEGEDGFLEDEDEDGDEDEELFAGGEGEEGFGGEGEDEEEEGEDGEGDDYAASFLEPDDAPREVVSGGTAWGEAVLRAAQEVLSQPAMKNLELYLFRALPANRKVDIRLDRLDDPYGSPSIDDIERFQRALIAALERDLGAEAAGEVSFEVSSPGAERRVEVPGELRRFGALPLQVEYRSAEGQAVTAVLLLDSLDEAAGTSAWRLANVRANATVKGRALSKRQLAAVTAIPLADIVRVRVHVDF